MNRKILIASLLNGLLLIGLFGWMLWSKSSSQHYFITTAEVYNEFELTKQLTAELDLAVSARQLQLDSLENLLRGMATQINAAEDLSQEEVARFQQLEKSYQEKKVRFDQDNEALAEHYTKEIWTQLNQYIEAYGEEHDVNFLFGSHGQGNLMYARDGSDLTEDVLAYVNLRYHDENIN